MLNLSRVEVSGVAVVLLVLTSSVLFYHYHLCKQMDHQTSITVLAAMVELVKEVVMVVVMKDEVEVVANDHIQVQQV
jgi:hypothetical protein